MKKRKVGAAEYYEGSTNIYTDLGYEKQASHKSLRYYRGERPNPRRSRSPARQLPKDGKRGSSINFPLKSS